jgi:alpha-tubulin suppressor-like RCC1 family protein
MVMTANSTTANLNLIPDAHNLKNQGTWSFFRFGSRRTQTEPRNLRRTQMRPGKRIRRLGLIAATVAGTLGLAGEASAQYFVSPDLAYVNSPGTAQLSAMSTAPLPLQGVKTVVSGAAHTCALMLDGTVKCWGYNGVGQLGVGTYESSTVPGLVSNLNQVTAITAGGDHTCALISGGTMKCWGDNLYGELGNGSTGQAVTLPTPVQNLSGPVVGIAAGEFHTCAIISGGSVQCWGWNNYGQLGDNNINDACPLVGPTTNCEPLPIQVPGLSFVTAIAAGYAHTCVLEASTGVYCWGQNGQGQLGNGSTTQSWVPVQSQLDATKAIAAGGDHTCALLAYGGDVMCWGDLNSSTTPNYVNVTGAKAIATAGSQACALLSSGSVQCWGFNQDGQLGNGSYNYTLNAPVNVSGVSDAISIAAGGEPTSVSINESGEPQEPAQTYAVLANGTVMAWGLNDSGQLGNGTTTTNPSPPTQVEGHYLPYLGARQIANGALHTCAVMGDGSAQCWGYNANGQLGNGSTTNSPSPVKVTNLSNAIAIAAGWYHTCALIATGSVECWGDDTYGEGATCSGSSCYQPQTVSGVQGAIAIAAGGTHTCALIYNGTVNCWGQNYAGNGCTSSAYNCLSGSMGVNDAVAITAGSAHSCALFAGGGASCWGDNTFGELGNGSTSSVLLGPTNVSGLAGWETWATSITAGYDSTCVLLFSGTAECWGFNAEGQLGNGSTNQSNVPTAVSNLAGASTIASNVFTTCAALANGTLQCWGLGAYGNFGNNSTNNSSVPVTTGLTGVTAVSVGETTTSALLADGTVQDWGYGALGDLGNGSTTSYSTPVPTSPLVPLLWSSTSPNVATVNPSTGLATVPAGVAAAEAVIEMTYEGQTAYGEVIVN